MNHAERLGVDNSKVYVTGNSAGGMLKSRGFGQQRLTPKGQLAATVALKIADSGKASSLAAQILRIPLTCHPSYFPGEKPAPKEDVPIFNDSATHHMLGESESVNDI